ncbi:hypothetical protein H5410_006221 [Solanum commersonii]|uniref:At2g35280-like TPR domain-containing protein n=1 Tax=Solanum commersonii TaxID=4109 RepID=A0A9J6A9P2_SOLCO|nr:hypothetical protein H5410_006221 [Solanum commersonii]
MLNDEFDDVDMNNHDAEIGKDDVPDFESHNPPIPIVGSNIPCSSQSSRVNNVRDDVINFYKGMTFKNKEELANSLKIACLKKTFRLKKVINSRNIFSFKCSYPECNWWLRVVKFTNSDRFVIRIYENYHTCGSEHLTSHNPHATTKVIGKYFENKFPNGKGPSTRDMSNQLLTELGCKVVTHFYKGANAYDRCEFNDHFNQIRDLVPKAAETLGRIGFRTWSRAFFPGNSSRVLNQKVTLVNISYRRWSIVQEVISFLKMCRASGNLEALYIKDVFDFFNLNDPTALGMISQVADGGHIGASYVLAIISIFSGGESMREGLMFIANMKKTEPLKVRRCRHNLRNSLGGIFNVLNQIANEPSVYQKVILLSIPVFIWPCSVVQRCNSFLEMCRAWGNLEALYRKCVYDFFKRSDSNALEILSQAADGGHIGASYVLAIISIFYGGESMREGLMFIANMTPLKLRRCREKLRYTLYGWVPEPHLLEKRSICCTVQSLHFRCELCRCDLEIDEVVKFLY